MPVVVGQSGLYDAHKLSFAPHPDHSTLAILGRVTGQI